MAVVVAVGGRRSGVARWCAVGFGVVGGLFYLAYAPPSFLIEATELSTPIAVDADRQPAACGVGGGDRVVVARGLVGLLRPSSRSTRPPPSR